MITAIIGQKVDQSGAFLEDGTRIPVTFVRVEKSTVVEVKTKGKHGYSALQLGIGSRKKANRARIGHGMGAQLEKAPIFLKEIRIDSEEDLPEKGSSIQAGDILKPGDIVDVIGVSKGKGYAGGVKRYHFKGGPRTHGQSDRERAPGSIGQTTTPGRVYKGKKMAGRMGHDQVTVKNLEVVDITNETLTIKGLVPGGKNTYLVVRKVGEMKKFSPLYKESAPEEQPIQPESA